MNLPTNLDPIDVNILLLIAQTPDIPTRAIQSAIKMSRTQTLKRLERLIHLGLIVRSSSAGRAYSYTLHPEVNREEVEQLEQPSLTIDLAARRALHIISFRLADLANQIEIALR